MSAVELAEWQAFYEWRAEEQEAIARQREAEEKLRRWVNEGD
jgi:hypothetical protein